MLRTNSQSRMLHTLLNSNKLMHRKADLIASYTNNRTASSTEMTKEECEALLKYLQKLDRPTADREAAQRMRKKLFSIAHELGWELPGGKVDTLALNAWIEKFGYLHKPLMRYTHKELPQLVSQFEEVLKHKYNKQSN